MRRQELRPEAEDLLKTLEARSQEDPPTIIRRQQQQIDHLLRVVGQQGTTIRKLHEQLNELQQQPPKLRIESLQALYIMLQETITSHTGITFPLGRITFPRERVRTSQIRALLQAIQPLRLADHSTPETSKFLTKLLPKLSRLLEQYPSAEEIIPFGPLERTFTF